MKSPNLGRRAVVAGAASLASLCTLPAMAQMAQSGLEMQVVKDPDCGCCTAWIEIMRSEGFQVEVQNASWEALSRFKAQSGVSEAMASCHTAHVEGYVIEGHVPAADIRRLLAERPEAVGLSVPGMPYGSPGMGPEAERDSYAVHLIRKDGSTEVFTRYDGK